MADISPLLNGTCSFGLFFLYFGSSSHRFSLGSLHVRNKILVSRRKLPQWVKLFHSQWFRLEQLSITVPRDSCPQHFAVFFFQTLFNQRNVDIVQLNFASHSMLPLGTSITTIMNLSATLPRVLLLSLGMIYPRCLRRVISAPVLPQSLDNLNGSLIGQL